MWHQTPRWALGMIGIPRFLEFSGEVCNTATRNKRDLIRLISVRLTGHRLKQVALLDYNSLVPGPRHSDIISRLPPTHRGGFIHHTDVYLSMPHCVCMLTTTGLRRRREEKQPAYLITLMTRHVMRAAVNTQMNITMFFRVGRCVIRYEILDPTAASVTLFVSSSSLSTDEDDDDDEEEDVEFNCVAGEERVCGSALTLHRAAMTKVKARLDVTMMMLHWGGKIRGDKKNRVVVSGVFLRTG